MTLNWKIGGLALGAVFFLAVLLVKPIGVSTQFVILNGIVGDWVRPDLVTESADGFTSSNAYLAKSGGKYAKAVSNPINYGFLFVLAMMVGSAVSSRMNGGLSKEEKGSPRVWRDRFGNGTSKRFVATFVGGFVVLYGARLAGGCTSGHMMSGMMQTSLSGYLFAAGAFAAAIPTAILLFKKGA
ncbi:MAG: YeeE/YedE thiosulfate transporter family protein [Planctomycetota bacterium]|nr:YeeE/YedE thiosulfate transporter family protein [Planctomycetota bacterium]